MEIHKGLMRTLCFLSMIFIFLSLPVLAIFSGANFPDTVRVFDKYGFEIKFNDTSVEKCYLVIYNTGDEIVQYHYPVPKDCRPTFWEYRGERPYKSCVPAQLYLESDGTLRFQFEVDSTTFLSDENYTATVYCGEESYSAVFTTKPGMISSRWFNWTLTIKDNVEFIVALFILLGFSLVVFYRLWFST